MEYRFNDEQNKKIVAILIFLIVFVGVIGGLIFYTSNDKLAVMSRVDKIFDIAVNNGFDIISEYDKENIVEDVTFKANMEQNIENEKVSTELITGTIHTNLSKENEYNIIKLSSEMQGQNINAGLYEKEGIIYINLNNQTYQLNDEKIEVNENYNIKDIQQMYNLIYKTAKKQLKDLDFYRLTDDTTKQTKIGISLTDKRVKEIIIDTLNVLKENEEFIELYSNLNDIEKDKVVKNVEEDIKNIKEIEALDSNVTKLDIYTSGLLNSKTDKIVITRTEKSIIKFTANMYINENGVSIDLEKNNQKINLSLTNNNDMYSLTISAGNFNFKFNIENYNFSINAEYGEYKMFAQFTGEENNEGEIEGKGNIGFNLNQTTKIVITFDEKLSFKHEEESVNLGNVKSANELFGNFMMLNQPQIY